jgi:DNA-binding NtrC family response regulator
MTGSALAAEIQRIHPDIPVLMVSGGDRSEPGKARPTGVWKILRKPHTLDELEQAIREVMGQRDRP